MRFRVSDKFRIAYLIFVIIFLIISGIFWLDYLGLITIGEIVKGAYSPSIEKKGLPPTKDSKIELRKEELSKEKERLKEYEEKLKDKERKLKEWEEKLKKREEEIIEMKKELEKVKKQLEEEKKLYKSEEERIKDIAKKITSMPPEDAVNIMINWDDLLIIRIIRQIDKNAEEEGVQSISPYLLSLMQKKNPKKVSNIIRKMSRG